MKMTFEEAIAKYGAIENGMWLGETKHCIAMSPPPGLKWINTIMGSPVQHIYCNSDMALPLKDALSNIISRGLVDELKTFDGCFMIRDVRAEPGKPSCHSYALAIDLNAKENPLGKKPVLTDAFVKCFTDEGFTWGGNFSRSDGMHFSYAWE